ncbi:HTTM domain-containing protein [Halorussus halobius]|uniref:HTTM domain-containing protein n=1 Tax=Halorussus halobius TaxID=1710537 RepID=UPI001FCE8A09|nr:HTTM domain-containing protein [Halorussus halobius]
MTLRDAADRLRARVGGALARRLSVDPRALAAVRVSVGLLLVADLAIRAGHLTAFYTDAGVMPRALVRDLYPGLAALSLHALSGAAWFQGVLFVLAGAAAVALALGYRTRLATAASLVLLVSLHARNPLILNGGDSVLRRLLFWGLFLPLGRRWSVDALRREGGSASRDETTRRVASVASAALLVQVVVVYAANGLFKLRGDRWLAGEGSRIALGLDQLTTGLGSALADFPALLGLVDRLWLGLLVTSVLLVVLTGWARALFAGLFVGMHLGMAATLNLGVFPLVSAAGLLAFLPPTFWDAAERLWAAHGSRRLDFGRVLAGADRLLPGPVRVEWPGAGTVASGLRTGWSTAKPGVVGGLLALVLLWNAATLGYAGMPDAVSETVDPEDYRWDMFAPEPRSDDGWYVVVGNLTTGETRDPLRGGELRWDRPPNVAATYPDVRWYKYLVELQRGQADRLGPAFGDYLCREWNADHGTQLENLTAYYVEERVRLDEPETTERVELFRYACSEGLAES